MKTLFIVLAVLASVQFSNAADKTSEKNEVNRKIAASGEFACADRKNLIDLQNTMGFYCDKAKNFSLTFNPSTLVYAVCCIAK